MTLVENALLSGATRQGLVKNGFIDWAATGAFAAEIVKDFDVRTPGTHVAARALSGGNLQKFVVGRELSQAPSVIVINQPTWGVDAAAAAAIRQAILDRAAAGEGDGPFCTRRDRGRGARQYLRGASFAAASPLAGRAGGPRALWPK